MRRFPARFDRAIQTLVVIAKILHRLLESGLLCERFQRRELKRDGGRLMRKLQQRRVVGRTADASLPFLHLRLGQFRHRRRYRLIGG